MTLADDQRLVRAVNERRKRERESREERVPKGKRMMEAHFVTFYSPGTFVAEDTTKPIDAWDPDLAKQMAKGITERHNATPYGFRFKTRRREDDELDSKVVASSGMYYLGGVVETLEQVKMRATDKDRILISNMECNHWDRIITNTNSWKWTQPLEEGDVVLEWP